MSAETKQAKWKQPDAVCKCMQWLEEKEPIRWSQTGDMVTLALVIDPLRKRKNARFAFIRYCPNCGAANFDVIEEAQPVAAPPMTYEELVEREG